MSQTTQKPASEPARPDLEPATEPASALIRPLLWILIPLFGLIAYAVFLM